MTQLRTAIIERTRMAEKINPIRETNAEAIALARGLVSGAKHGALGVIDPQSGAPFVSRVATATDEAGTPIILVSDLSRHTQALKKDGRCSLLLGEPGKGDPLAHPRITLICAAVQEKRDDAAIALLTARFIAHQPKAALYAGFADFSFFRLDIQSAAMNGGFGRAFNLTAADLLLA